MRVRAEHSIDAATLLPGHARCGRLHGHTYKLEVVLEGPGENGILTDFRELKRGLREAADEFDHADLSAKFDYPSCESICESIFAKLKARFPTLESLRVWEGEGKWVELDRSEA